MSHGETFFYLPQTFSQTLTAEGDGASFHHTEINGSVALTLLAANYDEFNPLAQLCLAFGDA